MESKNIIKSNFEIKETKTHLEESTTFTQVNFLKDAVRRFKNNKMAKVGFVIIVIIFLLAILGPYINPHTYKSMIKEHTSLPPRIPFLERIGIFDGTRKGSNVYLDKGLEDVYYWFGTDHLGRDIWTRIWEGTRVSFFIAFLAVSVDMFIGITYGMISAYFGGKTDLVLQRIIEVIAGIPRLVIVTLLVLIMKPGILTISISIMVTGWIGMSRVVRAHVLKFKELDFVQASKTLGTSNSKIIISDLLPNVFGQVVVMSMFSIPGAIFYESFLAFIGLGLQPPLASLGVLISSGYDRMLIYPHMVTFPVIVLSLLMLSFNFIADGLRDALDPEGKEV